MTITFTAYLKDFFVGVTSATMDFALSSGIYDVCASVHGALELGELRVLECVARGRAVFLQMFDYGRLRVCEIEVYGSK